MSKEEKESKAEKEKVHTTLAVKYRPKILDKVIGQEAAVAIIRGMMKTGKIPRTIMIHGPYGSGKTTLARIIMRYVNCQHEKGADHCDGCDSCKAWLKGQHPDVHEMDAGNLRGIDNVREIQKVAGFLPRYKRRGYILDECHALTKDAWNASLKLFEEPPGHSMFLMSTTDPQKIPETIQSRSLQIKLEPIDEEALYKLVRRVAEKEGNGDFPKSAAKMVAEAAMGHPRNALSILEQVMLYMESEKLDEKKLEKQLPEIVQKVLGLPSEQVVFKYYTAILTKDYETAFMMLREIQNAPVFLGRLTFLVCQTIYYTTARKTMDSRYIRFIGGHEKTLKKYWSERRLAALLEESLKTYERMKQYIVPEREGLDLFTMKVIQLAK